MLRIEKAVFGRNDGSNDGWNITDRQGSRQASYVCNGKTVFALQTDIGTETVTVLIEKALESYVRLGIHYGLMCALYRECVGFHGVTLLCGEEIVILSAPSGTGKTTLARLLETYCDAIVINGDFALLIPTEDGLVFEPTPFCGSSGRSLKHRVFVDRVVFLDQAKFNAWQGLSGREAMIRFMNNAFIPEWEQEMNRTILDNVIKCVSMVKANRFSFEPTKEAAETFYRSISVT